MHNVLEVDLTNEAKASLTCTCDNCGTVLGESWTRGKDNMSLSLSQKDEQGYDTFKQFHLCNEACLLGLLNKRAEKSA